MGLATKTVAIIVIVLAAAVGGVAYYFLTSQQVTEYPIGALLPLTGDLAAFGRGSSYAIQLAIEDANSFARSNGKNVNFTLIIEDSKTDPTTALQKLQSLAARGVKVVIGPMASSEVSALKDYAQSNQIVVISQSSTSPKLAIANDTIFRVPPADELQGKAIAKLLNKLGISRAVSIVRDDSWGTALFDEVKKNFVAIGGAIEQVKYDPSKKDFSAEISLLGQMAQSTNAQAVLFISFDEAATLGASAAKDSRLSSLRWLGCDGEAFSDNVLAAGQILASTKFIGTIAGSSGSTKSQQFKQAFTAKFGVEPRAYDFYAYDAAWLAAMTILQVGKYDGSAVAAAIPSVAASTEGVTGNLQLNQFGDRAYGSYTIWMVVSEGGQLKYVDAGGYDVATDTVTLTRS